MVVTFCPFAQIQFTVATDTLPRSELGFKATDRCAEGVVGEGTESRLGSGTAWV